MKPNDECRMTNVERNQNDEFLMAAPKRTCSAFERGHFFVIRHSSFIPEEYHEH